MTAVTAWAAVSHSNPKHFLNAKVREHIPALLGTGDCSDKWLLPCHLQPAQQSQQKYEGSGKFEQPTFQQTQSIAQVLNKSPAMSHPKEEERILQENSCP